jgi:hypothetical protein
MIALDLPRRSVTAYTRSMEPIVKTTGSQSRITIHSRPPWRDVIRAIESLRWLRDDWDDSGAIAPSLGIVDSATDLARTLSETDLGLPTTVLPTPAGSILFTWEYPIYFELEIRDPYVAEWKSVDPDGVAKHGVFK